MNVLLLSLFVSLTSPQNVLCVKATQARVRASPDKKAKVVTTIPIGAEVKVLAREKGFYKIESLKGLRGFVSQNMLGARDLSFDEHKESAQKAKNKKRAIERWVARYPNSLEAIEAYETLLHTKVSDEKIAKAQKAKDAKSFKGPLKSLYTVRKGWVAAKRRSLSPFGPLYVIDQGRARLPFACDERANANQGRTPSQIKTKELRARATPLASSGKMVSITERGYLTQKLSMPSCDNEQLVYTMPKRVKRGALVPSWLVAGYKVTPFKKSEGFYRAASHRHVVTVLEENVTVSSFTKTKTFKEGAPGVPIAAMSDRMGVVDILFWVSGEKVGCAADAPAVQWASYRLDDGASRGGPIYSSDKNKACPEVFKGLEGEERDIFPKTMMSEAWKR